MSHCSLAVSRGPRYKYVQFAAAPDLFPPLLFDLEADPSQLRNLCQTGSEGWQQAAWDGAQELLQWHMRTGERDLSGSILDAERGLVVARDTWR
jgi:hypothetical protein